MTSESDKNNKLFDLPIAKDLQFNRQRGIILTWKGRTESDEDDIAVSFQEKEGVHDIWYNLHFT